MENKAPEVKMFLVSSTTLDKVLNYLTTRPWGEVVTLINSLTQEVAPQMDQKSAPVLVEEKQA